MRTYPYRSRHNIVVSNYDPYGWLRWLSPWFMPLPGLFALAMRADASPQDGIPPRAYSAGKNALPQLGLG